MSLPSMRFLMGALLSISTLLAMEPPDPGMIEAYRKDGTLQQKVAFARSLGNHKVSNGLAERAHYKLVKAAMDKGLIAKRILPTPPDAWKDMKTTGDVKVLTILIDFSDHPHNEAKNSRAKVEGRIFGDGDAEVTAPYESFRQFYLRSSYDQLNFQGNVLGWYRPGYTRAHMAQTTVGRERLIKEALTKFHTDGHDFSQYDNNGDGTVDFFSVVWTGPDNGWSNFWWGYQTSFGDDSFKLDGVGFKKYSWQWESRPVGGAFSPETLIHEQGHGLGLPDYYDYDDAVGPRGGVGGLDIMDWEGDHNCFSKWLLDWITPEMVDTKTLLGPTVKSLRDQATNQDALLVMPDASFADLTKPFGEFFMVQNRQLTGNDANRSIAPTGSGLLIWHVDSRLDGDAYDYRYDNSFTEHKLLRLMEADGLESLEDPDVAVPPNADAGDFYAGTDVLGTGTTPNSARYDGTYTYFGINAISASQSTMTFNVYTETPDATAPTGQPTQPTGSVSADSATFAWAIGSAGDSDGQIIGYYLQVGSTPGGSDIFDDRVGNVFTKTVTDLGTYDGKPIYARVRAMNAAGLYTDWSTGSDPVTITLPPFAGCSALDNCDLSFKTIGTWAVDTAEKHTGTSSAHGVAVDNGTTTLQTTVVGPGTLTFWWAASTEKDYDFYSYRIDGATQTRISGDVNWAKQTVTIPAGAHVISWRWERDSSGGGTRDLVWLDDVQFLKDINGDGVGADILDLAYMAWAYGSNSGSPGSYWVPAADLDGDNDVDDNDISLFHSGAGF